MTLGTTVGHEPIPQGDAARKSFQDARVGLWGGIFWSLIVLTLVAWGCGGGSPGGPSPSPSGPTGTGAATVATLSGVYTMTLTASATCTQLPAYARTRRYVVTFTALGQGLGTGVLALRAADGAFVFAQQIFVEPNGSLARITLVVGDDSNGGGISGTSVDGSGLVDPRAASPSGAFSGEFSTLNPVRACTSVAHQISLARG